MQYQQTALTSSILSAKSSSASLPLKKLVAVIVLQAVDDDRDVQLVDDAGQDDHLLAGQELPLVDQHAVGLGLPGQAHHVGAAVDDLGVALEAHARGDLAAAEAVVDGRGEEQDVLVLLLVVVGDLEDLGGFAGVHGRVAEIELGHRVFSWPVNFAAGAGGGSREGALDVRGRRARSAPLSR